MFCPTGKSIFCVIVPVLPVLVFIFSPFGNVMVIGALLIVLPVTGSITVMVIVVLCSVLFNVFICSCDNLSVTKFIKKKFLFYN